MHIYRVLGHIPSHLLLTNTLPPEKAHLSDALLALANCLRTLLVRIDTRYAIMFTYCT